MRVLVTGATGFIGSALVPVLGERGHEVRVVGRDAGLERALQGCDAVIHLANLAHGRFDPRTLWRVNVEGTRALAMAAAAHDVRRMVYLSSIKASGEETSVSAFDGTETPAPQDLYGRAKLAAERALAVVSGGRGVETVILRPPLVYGPGVKANFRTLIRAISAGVPLPFAGIDNRRSLLYVGNLVDALARCIEADVADRDVFVLADQPALSTPHLCRALGQALGRRARLFRLPVTTLELLPPLRKLTRSLEIDDMPFRAAWRWSPPYSTTDGLNATARWFLHR
jgi:nucleoside-diphosphate-sugar epimerase